MASSPRSCGRQLFLVSGSGSTISLRTSPNRRCRRSVSADAEHWSRRRTASNRRRQLGGDLPRRVALGFALGLDVTSSLDEGGQPEQPCPVVMGGVGREPADTFAQIASSFGPSRAGSEIEPAGRAVNSVLSASGTGLVDTFLDEGSACWNDLRQALAVGVDLLELELVAIESEDRQPGIEPVREIGGDG